MIHRLPQSQATATMKPYCLASVCTGTPAMAKSAPAPTNAPAVTSSKRPKEPPPGPAEEEAGGGGGGGEGGVRWRA